MKLTDESKFPFGTHKGKRMDEVPASYLDWLDDRAWLDAYPDVKRYIFDNRHIIDKELEEQGLV